MAAVEITPRTDVDPEREARHCPECGKFYECKPRWYAKICPACNGRHIAQACAQRGVGRPPARPTAPVEPAEPVAAPALGEHPQLELEISAMRLTACWLEDLDTVARAHVLAWLWARYGDK
jgi:hypothetical protein